MNENAKTKLVLEYTGMDDFSCPVYKDQFGKLWKDIDPVSYTHLTMPTILRV